MSVLAAEQRPSPAYVVFDRRAVEDREKSQAEGHVVYKDVDYVTATALGGGTSIEKPVDKFLREKARDQFADYYREQYERWTKGQDEEVDGTPLKMWPPIGPAQLQRLISMNVRSVEDLASAPEDVLSRLGQGARSLQNQAITWLNSANDHGKVAAQVAELKRDNDDLREQLRQASKKISALNAKVGDDDEAKKRGRPRKTPAEE